MDPLKTLVYENFLEIFYGKRKKQLTLFYNFLYSHQSGIKTFLK